ncbi:trypsin-like peptidase domain-containing protein [Bacillus thuringiensis]|nr:trypsin-like peptidase domain-containing protein [Bacillus thuringiensis]
MGKILDVLDQLAKVTVKISCDNGTSGTGFFFNFEFNGKTVHTIITNRHVLEGVNSINIVFSTNDYFSAMDRTVSKFTVNYSEIQQNIIYHSDPDVDLCALIITTIIKHKIENELHFEISHLGMQHIPSDEELEGLRFVEELTMVGYPNGISDVKNNLPIFRRGTTATHPGVDFNGKLECVIDMTVTPGSSGSPVFIYNSDGYKQRNGNIIFGNERLIFLGINKAVFTLGTLGEIIEIPSPTKLMAHSNIGINLGIIVKSKAIYDLEEQIKSRVTYYSELERLDEISN